MDNCVTVPRMKGRQWLLLPFSRSVVRLASSSNTPAGRLLKLLLLRSSDVKLASSSNTPAGRLLRLLLPRFRVVRLLSWSNTPAGRLVRLLLFVMVRVVMAVMPSKSPAAKAVSEDLLFMVKVPVIPARSAAVTTPQVDLPVTAATMASRTSAVRLHTGVGDVTVTAKSATVTSW